MPTTTNVIEDGHIWSEDSIAALQKLIQKPEAKHTNAVDGQQGALALRMQFEKVITKHRVQSYYNAVAQLQGCQHKAADLANYRPGHGLIQLWLSCY